MNEYIFLLILVLVGAIILLVYSLIEEKNKQIEENKEYVKEITSSSKEQLELSKKCSVFQKENIFLKELVNKYEEEEYERLGYFQTADGHLTKNPIYEGKRALIGDYMISSYTNTKRVLQSLGFTVDIVKRKDDMIDRISYGTKYDVIFTNNIYPDGTGPELLKELRSYKGFSTPIVIHTVSKEKDYFLNEIGFDGYVEKTVTSEKLKPVFEKIFNN